MDAATMFIRVPLYKAVTEYTPVIPKLYWDVYSQEERIKAICNELDKICAYANTLGIQLNYNTAEIEALYNEFEEFKASGFDGFISIEFECPFVDCMLGAKRSLDCVKALFA